MTKYQNNSIKISGRLETFHKKVKMSYADSRTKNTNDMTILCRMYNLYTSKVCFFFWSTLFSLILCSF